MREIGQKKSCVHVLDVCGEVNIVGSFDFKFRWRSRERNRVKSKREAVGVTREGPQTLF